MAGTPTLHGNREGSGTHFKASEKTAPPASPSRSKAARFGHSESTFRTPAVSVAERSYEPIC